MRIAHFFTLSLVLLLGACGFQLRGTGSFDFAIKEFRFSADDQLAPLARELQERLSKQGVELSDIAEYQLHLGRENHSRRTVSFTAGTRNAEHLLTSSVEYEIRSGNLPALIKEKAEVQRSLAYNENHVSASSEEEQLMRGEMRQELIMQLMMRLQALQPAQLDVLRDKAQQRLDAEAAARAAEQQRLLDEQQLMPLQQE